jgi:hypothetical protein
MAFDPLKIFKDNKQEEAASAKEDQDKKAKTRTMPLRGPNGKFISKRALTTQKATAKEKRKKKVKFPSKKTQETSIVSFYGVDIRRVSQNKEWYFSTEDILSLAQPVKLGGKITKKDNYKKVFDEVTETISGVSFADAEGIIKIIRELNASFPGPLVRHLQSSLQTPSPADNLKPVKTKATKPAPPANPSDRVG